MSTRTLLFAAVLSAPTLGQDVVHGRLLSWRENGAWSWFEDERAIVDRALGRILVGSCADASGVGGAARSGDIDVAWLDVAAGRFGAFELHDRLAADDHNSPALFLRPDGRYAAMYGTHGGDRLSRWRISAPGDPTQWGSEATFQHGASLTYSNLHWIPDPAGQTAGVLYNFARSINFDPNVMVSADLGATWNGTGKLLTEGGSGDRPYLKYASEGVRVHVLATERHPRNYDNSIYHGYVEGGALHDSFGQLLDPSVLDATAVAPSAMTRVFQTGAVFGGTTMRRGWTIDLVAGPGGDLRALFEARANDDNTDHRLFFGRFDGAAWSVHEVCRLGAHLYAAEDDYTGLAALDPDDPTRLFVSTRVDPRGGGVHAHYELYEARSPDQGATWTFTPITEGSTVDNLRPIVPAWDAERTAVLWLRGRYSTYTDYDLAVVGIVTAPELPFDAATLHDATPQNTTLANGAAAPVTGPGLGDGPDDGLWHLRTAVGNGGLVWTASETGAEDAPLLRTRLAGLSAGSYDVHVLFWSDVTEDWSLRAGLTAASLRHLEKHSAATVRSGDIAGSLVTSGAGARLYSSWLGRADVDASGTLDVFVDDLAAGQSGATRTWYDAVAIAPVTCTPTTRHCPPAPNSTGAGARIERSGSCSIVTNDLRLLVAGAPPGAWSLFLYGQGRALTPLADGTLCLATNIGRMPAQLVDFLGATSRTLDLAQPLPGGPHTIALGSTWSFQLWFRDTSPLGANLSDALELTFSL